MILDLSKDFDVKKGDAYYDKLKNQKAKIEIIKPREKRSIDQNSYLHICLGYYCLHTGTTLNEAKQDFSDLLPEMLLYRKEERVYRRSTSDLDKEEMMVLIDYIRSFCHGQLGVYVPESTEYLVNQFQIRKELENIR